MDDASPPPPTSPKSATRFRPTGNNKLNHPPLDLVATSSSPFKPTPPNSPVAVPLRELLCYSPSPLRRSRTRLADKIEIAVDESATGEPCQKRRQNRSGQLSSPRHARRPRRRLDQEIGREEREAGVAAEEVGKVKKRRTSGRSKKDKLSLNSSVPQSSTSLIKINNEDLVMLESLGMLFTDLVMWRDVAKSSLWFGFGCLCFLSSCFTSGINLSLFSVMSRLGLLVLGLSFFSNTICQRNKVKPTKELKLTEDDVLSASRLFLPYVNFAISKAREVFSGEPSVTLKVAPFLLLGAQYGHLITLKRICALGFFTSFTGPRLYHSYAIQINTKAEMFRLRLLEAWKGCTHKKIVAGSALTAFWNLSSIKTRIVVAFIALVILRYNKQCNPEAEQKQEEQKEVDSNNKLEEEKKEEKKEVVVVRRKYKKGKQMEEKEDLTLEQAIAVLEEDLEQNDK